MIRNNKGQFIKGTTPHNKGKAMPKIREKNHYKWKGGTRATARRIAKRYGFDLTRCVACEQEKETVVHHVDGNFNNNKLTNLRILCFKCHNELHEIGVSTRFQKGHEVPNSTRRKISEANKGRIPPNKDLNPPKLNCRICNKEFSVNRARLKTAKYCSKLCANKAMKFKNGN